MKVSSLTTLYVENFFSEMREGNDMPLMLQFCYRFLACLRERLKYSTSCSFNYFTSERHYYSKPESNLIQVQLPKLRKPPRNTTITKSQLDEMRIWRAEHGQSVRQLTVRNLSTKDKPGTLPLNCYALRPDAPQPLDFSNLLIAKGDKNLVTSSQTEDILHKKRCLGVAKRSSILARAEDTSEFLLVRNEKDISAKDLVIAVTVFCQDPFLPLNFYPVERANLELEKIIAFLEDGNFKIGDKEIVLSEGCYERMLVVCLDLGDTMTLVEETEELHDDDCQTEETTTADERNVTATESRRRRSKRKYQSDYLYY